MATYSRILTQKIPWVEESGGLQTIGSQTVGHDRANKAQRLPFRHILDPPVPCPPCWTVAGPPSCQRLPHLPAFEPVNF